MLVTIDLIKSYKKSGMKPGEFNGVCPACGGTSFYFNIYSKKYVCFRASCGIRGQFYEDSGCVTPLVSLDDIKSSISALFNGVNTNIPTVDLDVFSDPLTKKFSFAYDYMRRRNFFDEDIKNYGIRVGKEYVTDTDEVIRRWKGRIIFPFFDTGVPVYAIGRSYVGSNPKYLNTDGEKSVIVYNIDSVKNGECIICEGLISSIAAKRATGVPSVCLLGYSMSEYQFYVIRSVCHTVYVSLDGGVDKELVDKIARKFLLSGCKVKIVSMPDGKDPDELGEDYKLYFDMAKDYNIL